MCNVSSYLANIWSNYASNCQSATNTPFDPYDSVLTEKTRRRLLDGWPGVFRHVILELMPVDALHEHFDPAMGRPTKELYSVAGLLLIKEFMDWTKQADQDFQLFVSK